MLRIHKDFEENNTVTVTVPLTEIDIDYIANRVIELLDEREKENNKETETPEESLRHLIIVILNRMIQLIPWKLWENSLWKLPHERKF